MNNPRISWQVYEEIDESSHEMDYIQYKSYTEPGSYIPGDYITKKIRVWNNHFGKEDVQDANNCTLVIAFKNFEDNFLLNLMTVSVNDVQYSDLEIDIDRAVVEIGKLSGVANTGTNSQEANYKNIDISIGPIPNNIKSELKSIYFYLEYRNE